VLVRLVIAAAMQNSVDEGDDVSREQRHGHLNVAGEMLQNGACLWG
jgi:hypothetical protein